MRIETVIENGMPIALISADEVVMKDVGSALDLAMTAMHETGGNRMAIDKNLISEDFFRLGSGMARDILQKYMNYHVMIAVYGDYSHYTSKPLHDFFHESNRRGDAFFVSTKDEAIGKLAGMGEIVVEKSAKTI